MKLKKETVLELGEILKSEFSTELDYKNLEKLAYSLVGYFDLLLKIENRHKFGNHSSSHIDSKDKERLDDNRRQN